MTDELSQYRITRHRGPLDADSMELVKGLLGGAGFIAGSCLVLIWLHQIFAIHSKNFGWYLSNLSFFQWGFGIAGALVVVSMLAFGFLGPVKTARKYSEYIRGQMRLCRESSAKLPALNSECTRHLERARVELNSRAFGPFWDAVEDAAKCLSQIHHEINMLSFWSENYYKKLRDQQHNFPPHPVNPQKVVSPSSAVAEFKRLVRIGQSDFQFASIWEQRKTQKVIIAGFQSLGEAVANLAYSVQAGFDGTISALSKGAQEIIAAQERAGISVASATQSAIETEGYKIRRKIENPRRGEIDL